ncbi:MAG: biotin/lipoyl-containing protein [Balneolales bacterium]
MKFEATINENTYALDFNKSFTNVEVNGTPRPLNFLKLSEGRFFIRLDRKTYIIDNLSKSDSNYEFTLNNRWHRVDIKDEQALLLEKMGFTEALSTGEGHLTAPMPGKILDILVSEGDHVKLGDPLIILEAMKMENELKAPISGMISTIFVSTGKSVDKNENLIEIKAIG